ncbi:MAG: amino acid ABC transporter permease [Erysipelotrichales bacterium]|nr:amino acid ABC transporter permease [Erysipelotrichales bacterium]
MNFIQNIISLISQYWPLLLRGAGYTLLLSAITVLGGTFFGTLITLPRLRKSWYKKIFDGYVEIVRGIPLLVQLFAIMILLPPEWNVLLSVAVALTVNSTAYISELMRAGIQAVDNGQYEAARTLGLSHHQTMFKVILPQAVKNVLPALGNEFIMVIKETSLASVFFVGDLMTQQQNIMSWTFLAVESYIIIAIMYLILTFSLSKLIRFIEKRLNK